MNSTVPPLVIRFGAIGDLIVTTPLLRALHLRHGRPCDVLARGNWPSQVFRELPFVGTLKTIKRKNVPYWLVPDKRELIRWLRARGEGPVYLFESDPNSHELLQKAGVKITVSCSSTGRLPHEHFIDYLARLCGFTEKDEFFDPAPVLQVSPEEQADCHNWLEHIQCSGSRIVLIQTSSRKSGRWWRKDKKGWLTERWVELIRSIVGLSPESKILLCGSSGEKKNASGLVQRVKDPRVISVAGDANLRRLFALLRVADSLISIDSGVAHAAAASGCPLVVLFGRTDPRDIGPRSSGSPVIVVTGPPGAPEPEGKKEWAKYHSMEGIAVDRVLDAWQSLRRS